MSTRIVIALLLLVTTVAAESAPLKEHYGHYFATRYSDTPAEAAALCEEPGVTGVNYRRTWREVEPTDDAYDFSAFDAVLTKIAASRNPQCQLWLFVENKSFPASPVRDPCPEFLSAYSAPNANGDGVANACFLWEPVVVAQFKELLTALATKYDSNPRVEGFIFQESALGFNGAYSQSPPRGTYTPELYRDALIGMVRHCVAKFVTSSCLMFLNFLPEGQGYLSAVSAAISAIPNNRAIIGGPDLLPNNASLQAVYEVLARHAGARSQSAQNESYGVVGCDLNCIFAFGTGGTFGDFREATPLSSGTCINSYFWWNHTGTPSATGLTWEDALPVIAANPYGPGWTNRCVGGGGPLGVLRPESPIGLIVD